MSGYRPQFNRRPILRRVGGVWTCGGLGVFASAAKPCQALQAWNYRRIAAGFVLA